MKPNYKKLRNNIPKSIRVGPKNVFNVVWVDSAGKSKNGRPHYGETDFTTKEIRIFKGLKDDLAVKTFFHETLHCFKLYKHMHLTEKQVAKFEKRFEFFMEFFLRLENGK